MKAKAEVYAVCAMIGAAAGWYLGGYLNSHRYAYDEYFLEQMTNMAFLALAGAAGGAGIAAVYHAGKGIYDFCKKKISLENKLENLEKLVEK
jgi:hypothetical protein